MNQNLMPNINDLVDRIKNIGDLLVPYNFPLGDPRDEDDLNALKITEASVDGYSVIMHYSKADYKSHFLITLQVFGRNFPFLPFNLVVKLAKKFLGDADLSLVELLKDNRKIYCWTLSVDKQGQTILREKDVEQCVYEGFEYNYMRPSQVNFY